METAMTTQQGLNEVVINKVQRMIENKAVGVQATMERLVNEGKIAQDYIGFHSEAYDPLGSLPDNHVQRKRARPDEYAERAIHSPRQRYRTVGRQNGHPLSLSTAARLWRRMATTTRRNGSERA